MTKADMEFGIRGDGEEVELHLGHFQPFKIPNDQARKLAALLLKHTGADVEVRGNRITATWSKRPSLDPNGRRLN